MKKLTVVNQDNFLTFNIVIVEEGQEYGLNNCLIAENTLVEFYDDRFNHTAHGQFITRYNLETIKNHNGAGLNLHGGIDNSNWYLTANNMIEIKEFLKDVK